MNMFTEEKEEQDIVEEPVDPAFIPNHKTNLLGRSMLTTVMEVQSTN